MSGQTGGMGSPSKSFQFIMVTSVHGGNKVMVTEGNITTSGIHGPQQRRGSRVWLRVKGTGSRWP